MAVAECSGYHRVQPCIIKLPWLLTSETLTIPCSAGKDDCSKPKLGINYTTTLHFFFYKGKTVWQELCRHLLPNAVPLQGLLWKAPEGLVGIDKQINTTRGSSKPTLGPAPAGPRAACHPPIPNMHEGCRMQAEPSCNIQPKHSKKAPKAASVWPLADIWASIFTMNGRSDSSLKLSPPALAGAVAFPQHFCNIKFSTSSHPAPPALARTQGRGTPE